MPSRIIGGSDDIRERPEWPQEGADRQRADEQDDLGLEDVHQFIEPGAAEGLFLGRGDAIPAGAGEPAGIAARDGGEVDPCVELGPRDARLLEPGPELVSGDPRERPVLDRGPQAGCLADQQDSRHRSVGLGIAGDRDRFAFIEVAGQVALAAGAEAGIEGDRSRAAARFGGRRCGASGGLVLGDRNPSVILDLVPEVRDPDVKPGRTRPSAS